MNSRDVGYLVDEWSALWFGPTEGHGGLRIWTDWRVVGPLLGGPPLPHGRLKMG